MDQGSLNKTPIERLFVQILDRRRTGTLTLEGRSGRHVLTFQQGTPLSLETPLESAASLHKLPVASPRGNGPPSVGALRAASPGADSTSPPRVESARPSEWHLRAGQTSSGERLLHLLAILFRSIDRDADFHFVERDLDESRPPPAVDALQAILRGTRAKWRDRGIRARVDALGDEPLVLRAEVPLERFQFSVDERNVIDHLLAGPKRLSELRELRVLSKEHLRVLVYVLWMCRCFRTGDLQVPPAGVAGIVITTPLDDIEPTLLMQPEDDGETIVDAPDWALSPASTTRTRSTAPPDSSAPPAPSMPPRRVREGAGTGKDAPLQAPSGPWRAPENRMGRLLFVGAAVLFVFAMIILIIAAFMMRQGH